MNLRHFPHHLPHNRLSGGLQSPGVGDPDAPVDEAPGVLHHLAHGRLGKLGSLCLIQCKHHIQSSFEFDIRISDIIEDAPRLLLTPLIDILCQFLQKRKREKICSLYMLSLIHIFPVESDVYVIVVNAPDNAPRVVEIENRAGGSVTAIYDDGSQTHISSVVRPVKGVGLSLIHI